MISTLQSLFDMFYDYELTQLTARPVLLDVAIENGKAIREFMGEREVTIKQIIKGTGISESTVRIWLRKYAERPVKIKNFTYWKLK